MIKTSDLIGRRLIMIDTPEVRPRIEKLISQFYNVCRLRLDNGMGLIFTEEKVKMLLEGKAVQGWVMTAIGEE